MTRPELNKFQWMLNAERVQLERTLGKRDGIAIERTSDALDEVQLASERELTTRGLERESRVLHGVRAALGRIADGTYGACLDCEEEISQKRLKAVPWATLCIACQEQEERNSQPNFVSQQRFLRDAA